MPDDYTELAPNFRGRVLACRHIDGFDFAQRLLREGEALFFVHDQVIAKVPVPVLTQEDFDHAHSQYAKGLSVAYELAAAPQPAMVIVISQEDDDSPAHVQQGWINKG